MEDLVRRKIIDVRSSAQVSAAQAFEQWESAASELYVPLCVTPVRTKGQSAEFHGSIDYLAFGELELTTTRGTAQRVRRSPRLIAASESPHLIATISVTGQRWFEQGESSSAPVAGQMCLLDCSRPWAAYFDAPWEQVDIQVPMKRIQELTGLHAHQIPTGVAMPAAGAVGLVSRFFRDLMGLERADAAGVSVLAGHGIDLLASAVLLAAGRVPDGRPAQILARKQVLDYMHSRRTDPALTVEQIAFGCAVSRSTLYRLFDESPGGVAGTLRRMRVNHAGHLLRSTGHPVASIAAASGFSTERQLYRAFRQLVGVTPGEYRAQWTQQGIGYPARADITAEWTVQSHPDS
ncbi:helix-turn-helix domain-containing protein [Nocardia sp. NPDC004860]|uniref:helix-turn-helix domain-containing protein n=1 Tax=Nocardia sp. NPDC004860 TaxID=3154557 RepID=UPI0033B76D5E